MSPFEILTAVPTIEGAGVHLKRVFGYHQQPLFDPFLLLDDFHGDDPRQYVKGFPWHPHRGIETITLLFAGTVVHGDSLGNSGVIHEGDIQWMTAGSGIVHQEMPRGRDDGLMRGLQLWANLPASQKMTKPAYRDVRSSQVPVVERSGCAVRVIAGSYAGTTGPVHDIVIDPELFVLDLQPGKEFIHSVQDGYTCFLYLLEGMLTAEQGKEAHQEQLMMLESGKDLCLTAGEGGALCLFAAGKPLNEPIAWGGPIVMNTREELRRAFSEYEAGTFLQHEAEKNQNPG